MENQKTPEFRGFRDNIGNCEKSEVAESLGDSLNYFEILQDWEDQLQALDLDLEELGL